MQSKTPHYQFDNHIKHGMKMKQLKRHQILNIIYINQALEKDIQLTLSNMKSNQ